MMDRQLIVYGRPNCPQCTATTRKADALGLTYRYVDLSQDPDTECRLQQEGHRALPVVEAADLIWGGFRPDLLDKVAQA